MPTSPVFPDLPLVWDLKWWERLVLAFRPTFYLHDSESGTSILAKRWRGRWYFMREFGMP